MRRYAYWIRTRTSREKIVPILGELAQNNIENGARNSVAHTWKNLVNRGRYKK
jgi:hypothetical protein